MLRVSPRARLTAGYSNAILNWRNCFGKEERDMACKTGSKSSTCGTKKTAAKKKKK